MSISLNQTHTVTACGACGVQFAYPEFLNEVRSKSGESVYCPNGHRLTIPAPDAVKRLQRELADSKAEQERLVRQREHANNSVTLLENNIVRLKRRIASLKGSNTMLSRRLNRVGSKHGGS